MAKKATKKIEGTAVVITFEETGDNLSVDLKDLKPEIVERLALHGLSQKLGDSYAGAEANEAFDKAAGVAKDLAEGNWTTRVAAGGPRSTQLAEALAAATGKSLEEAVAKLEDMDDEQKKALRSHPQIKAELARIKAEKAAAAAAKANAEVADAPALTI